MANQIGSSPRETIGEELWVSLEEAGYVWDGKRFGWFIPGEPEATFLSFGRVQDSARAATEFRKQYGRTALVAELRKVGAPVLAGDKIANPTRVRRE